jgi:hypothetical protein
LVNEPYTFCSAKSKKQLKKEAKEKEKATKRDEHRQGRQQADSSNSQACKFTMAKKAFLLRKQFSSSMAIELCCVKKLYLLLLKYYNIHYHIFSTHFAFSAILSGSRKITSFIMQLAAVI